MAEGYKSSVNCWSDFLNHNPDVQSGSKSDNDHCKSDKLSPVSCNSPNQVESSIQTNLTGTRRQWRVLLKPKSEQNGFHLFNILPALSNASPSLEKKGSERRNVNTGVLNSAILCQTMSKELELLKKHKHGVNYVKEFIVKLQKVLKKEQEFARDRLGENSRVRSARLSSSSQSEADGLPTGSASEDQQEDIVKLPKLGKVYADMRTCVKTCKDICNQWLETSLVSDTVFVENSISQQKQCESLQLKMLLHIRWLIEARLQNISCAIALYLDIEEFELEQIFYPHENKRFCKLIQAYNECCLPSQKRRAKMNFQVGRQPLNHTQSANQNGESVTNCFGAKGSQFSITDPLSAKDILNLLSSDSLQKFGRQISVILNSSLSFQISQSSAIGYGHDAVWFNASKVEVRPIQTVQSDSSPGAETTHFKSSFCRVIKRIAGITVPEFDEKKAREQCHLLFKWYKSHGCLMTGFANDLSVSSRLLRRSFTPRGQDVPDDTMSVASTDNMSVYSINSDMITSKSVTWRDSWSNDTVKSLITQHQDYFCSLLAQTYFLILFHISKDTCLPEPSPSVVDSYRQNIRFRNSTDYLFLNANISNMIQLGLIDENLRKPLELISIQLVIDSAVACSDNCSCEMVGKSLTTFNKSSLQKQPKTQLTVVTWKCMCALYPLLHVMESYPSSDCIATFVLPKVESILTAIFSWIRNKIQEFLSSSSLQPLLQIILSDLREVTSVSLDCLRLVESCHNYIESKRNSNAAALDVATQHLQNIDMIITNMQVLSGDSMKLLSSRSYFTAYDIVCRYFPPQKAWLQKHFVDSENENKYAQELVQLLVKTASTAVAQFDAQSQLAAMTPIVNSVYDSCLKYIAKNKIKFSVQGALQLSSDFSTIINYITSEMSQLLPDVQASLSSLHSVRRAIHVAQLLQSTFSHSDLSDRADFHINTNRSSVAPDTEDEEEDPEQDEKDDRFWLSLRKQGMNKTKSWTSFLPCMDAE